MTMASLRWIKYTSLSLCVMCLVGAAGTWIVRAQNKRELFGVGEPSEPRPPAPLWDMTYEERSAMSRLGSGYISNSEMELLNARIRLEHEHHRLEEQYPARVRAYRARFATYMALRARIIDLRGSEPIGGS